MKKALVPGTFDPITNGHLDVITRAAALFDEVGVGVAYSAKKGPLFTVEERVALAEQATSHLPNVTVAPFNALLVDFAAEIKASAVVKGLRAITDFEYEFQMTAANYQMDKDVETMFIISTCSFHHQLYVKYRHSMVMSLDLCLRAWKRPLSSVFHDRINSVCFKLRRSRVSQHARGSEP